MLTTKQQFFRRSRQLMQVAGGVVGIFNNQEIQLSVDLMIKNQLLSGCCFFRGAGA